MTGDGLLEQIASQVPAQAWVVGGALRDCLLGVEARDIDLVLADANSPLLNPDYWTRPGLSAFWLDQDRGTVRLVNADMVLDLAAMQGNMQSDLSRRDFTVNCMALPLTDWLRGELSGLIDPFQGREDLESRRLRLVHRDAIQGDPVRILRAARLGVELSLQSDAQTSSALIAAAPALNRVPGERIWMELSLILQHRQAASGLANLERWGAVAALFPEVAAMQRVGQNKYHQFTVDVHSQRAFAAFSSIIHHGSHLPSSMQAYVRQYWQQLSAAEQSAIMLAAWLHDIGKPATRVDRGDKVTFYEHEHVGAKMAVKVAERLRLSNEQSRLIHTFIAYHMYPMQLWRTGHLDDRLIHRLYRRTGDLGVAIVLFTLADHLAKGERVAAAPEFREHQQVAERMLLAYFCRHDQVVSPQPLLDGEQIIAAVEKQPGPWVGE
ncbi:MAG: HDIG domain-containing metalloprotein [Bacillota bacterium]